MKTLRYVLLIIVINIPTIILASPSDYGRDYSIRDGYGSFSLCLLLIGGIIIYIIYKVWCATLTKIDDIGKSKNGTAQSSQNIRREIPTTKTPNIIKCEKCQGTGWSYRDITHLRKLCSVCGGNGFIESIEYSTIQKQIKELDKLIDNRFEEYIMLLSEKINNRIKELKTIYLKRGEDFYDSGTALSKIEEIRNLLVSSISYKRMKQIYERDLNNYIKSKSNVQPRGCFRLTPCHYCFGCSRDRVSLKYKKLKLLFDRENRGLIERYIYARTKYSNYIIFESRRKRNNDKYIRYPFDRWIHKEEQKRKALYQSLISEKEKCHQCEICKGEKYIFVC